MKKASDVERMLAHIGDPDMRYMEFDTPRDETRARADWSLLDSATGGKRSAAVTPTAVAGPTTVSGPTTTPDTHARPAYVERELTPAEIPADETRQPSGEAQGQLQRVFAKLRGDAPPAAPQRTEAPTRTRETPLSQIFKRLS